MVATTLGGYHKDCLEEFQPVQSLPRGQLSKTEPRKPVEKVVGTCPYHKECFDEHKPVEREKVKLEPTEIRKAREKEGLTSQYHKRCFEEEKKD